MPKNVHFGEFLQTWSLRSNSVTRQVSFNRTKIGENAKIEKLKCNILCDFQTLWSWFEFQGSIICNFCLGYTYEEYQREEQYKENLLKRNHPDEVHDVISYWVCMLIADVRKLRMPQKYVKLISGMRIWAKCYSKSNFWWFQTIS